MSLFAEIPGLHLDQLWRLIDDQKVPITVSRPPTPNTNDPSPANARPVLLLNPDLDICTASGQPVVVRKEYPVMLDAVKYAHKVQLADPRPPSRLFLVGNPGIGKTLFLAYALAKWLEARQPVAISWDSKYLYYFDGANPPQVLLISSLRPEDLSHNTIILLDSNNTTNTDPTALRTAHRLVVVATSPDTSRWKWAEKDYRRLFLFVEDPSFDELKQMKNVARPGKGPNLELLPLVGNSPRRLEVMKAKQVIREYRSAAATLAANTDELNGAMRGRFVSGEAQAENFHKFFLDVPVAQSLLDDDDFPPVNATADELRARARITYGYHVTHQVATSFQFTVLREAYNEAERSKGGILLRALKGLSDPLPFAIAFEALILADIEGSRLVAPAFRYDGGLEPLPFPLISSTSTLARTGALPSPPINNDTNAYFVRVEPFFPTVDAVIVSPTRVLLMQLTISGRHNASFVGLRRVHDWMLGTEFGGDGGRQWILLFVVPSSEDGTALVSSTKVASLMTEAETALGLKLAVSFMVVKTLNAGEFIAPKLPQSETQDYDALETDRNPKRSRAG